MWFRNIFRRKPAFAPSFRTGEDPLELSPAVFTRLDHLRIRSSQHLRGAGAGQRPSLRRRPAADFREHRKYVAGDDVRFVDWKASARSEQVFLKQGEQPQETTIHLLLDSSGSMAWGEPPKHRSVLRLAAALGYLALSGDDRLQVLPLHTDLSPSDSKREKLVFKGKGQFPVFWKSLGRIAFGGRCRLLETVQFLTRSHRGGVVLVLSDLLDTPDLSAALDLLPRPAWEVTMIHTLHPDELDPKLDGSFLLTDTETGRDANYDVNEIARTEYRSRLENWRQELETTCVAHRAFYTLVSTGASLEREILPHLHRIHILEPA